MSNNCSHRVCTGVGSSYLTHKGELVAMNIIKIWMPILPNIPTNSAIIMDNAPYHSRNSVKIPCTSNNKTEIFTWLDENGILHPPMGKILKVDLLKLVANSEIQDYLSVEEICECHGQTVIRLPPYHSYQSYQDGLE